MTSSVGAGQATRRKWIGLAIIALPCIVYGMDLTVLNLAVPSISAALNPTAAQLLWIVDVYDSSRPGRSSSWEPWATGSGGERCC